MKTTRLAEDRNVSVLCLGALNKAEWMNNGVLDRRDDRLDKWAKGCEGMGPSR